MQSSLHYQSQLASNNTCDNKRLNSEFYRRNEHYIIKRTFDLAIREYYILQNEFYITESEYYITKREYDLLTVLTILPHCISQSSSDSLPTDAKRSYLLLPSCPSHTIQMCL